MQLTRNIKLSEFDCRDGTPVPESLIPAARRAAQNLQVLRDWWQRPLIITSGYRHEAYNRSVGGAEQSFHLGRPEQDILAADFYVEGTDVDEIGDVLHRLIRIGAVEEGGLGRYPRGSGGRGWVHYDCRGERARWQG